MKTLDRIGRIAGLLTIASLLPAFGQSRNTTIALDRGALCVTEGEIQTGAGNRLSVDSTKMRAYVNQPTTDRIEAQFTYLGGTAEQSRLGSGEIRSQFGLKLHAQNACNLIYAMWRMEPESKIVVSIKKNPGQTMSSECGNRGYQNIKPQRTSPVPVLHPGDSHTLSAELRGNDLQVSVDGAPVWQGDLGPGAAGIAGPLGLRSDNVRLALDLRAGVSGPMRPNFRLACKSGPGVSD
jgi:hypothetical protein